MSYYLKNGKKYTVKFERDKIKVTEYTGRFNDLFFSESDVTMFDNYAEVREYLTEMNGGEEIC